MKLPYLLMATVIVALSPVAVADYCSCASEYCEISTSCAGACYAVCGTTCTAGCGGGGPNGPLYRTPPALWDPAQELNLNAPDRTPQEISDLLSQQLGAEVVFVSTDESLTMDVKRMPLGEFLKALSRHGVVAAYRSHEEMSDLRAAGNCTLLAQQAGSVELSKAMSFLLGREVTFQTFGDILLTAEVKNMPVYRLVELLKEQGVFRNNS